MINVKASSLLKFQAGQIKSKAGQLTKLRMFSDPVFAGRVIGTVLVLGIVFGQYYVPVLAEGGDIGSVISGLIEKITEIIRSFSVGAGVLGLVFWGLAKLARPYFPSLSQKVNDYIPDLLTGLVVIAFANELVSGISSAIGSGSGN